jgi:hypothetical protein
MRLPDYHGGGLVNLVAELEHRLTGRAASPRLHPSIGAAIPTGRSYVLVLIDGLGDHQLDHPQAAALARARRGQLDAPWPTQTSVATATLATGLPPSQHGLVSYLLHLPGAGVVNTLLWYPIHADQMLEFDATEFLPAPNTAERLAAAGGETVVVEPEAFVGGPLDRVLYRGTRVIGVQSDEDEVAAAHAEAAEPGRLVVVYLPHVDTAAHAVGQESEAYATALDDVSRVWNRLAADLPPGVTMVGTADHGHVDVTNIVDVEVPEGVTVGGDSRVLHLRGTAGALAGLAADLPGILVTRADLGEAWGPGPFHPGFEARAPDALLFADDACAFAYPGNDIPLVGYHGGMTAAEVEIPLLVAERPS